MEAELLMKKIFIARNVISYTFIRNNTLLPGMESICESDCRNLHVLIQLIFLILLKTLFQSFLKINFEFFP